MFRITRLLLQSEFWTPLWPAHSYGANESQAVLISMSVATFIHMRDLSATLDLAYQLKRKSRFYGLNDSDIKSKQRDCKMEWWSLPGKISRRLFTSAFRFSFQNWSTSIASKKQRLKREDGEEENQFIEIRFYSQCRLLIWSFLSLRN